MRIPKDVLYTPQKRAALVKLARERIFGSFRGYPGERHLLEPLLGRAATVHYHASKYALQPFQVSDYFEMQSLRYRENEETFDPLLAEVTSKIRAHKDKLQEFFRNLDEKTYSERTDIQDLHALLVNQKIPVDLSFSVAPRDLPKINPPEKPLQPPVYPEDLELTQENVKFLARRHRYIDPLYRKRRLKWLENYKAQKHRADNLARNQHFLTHPDSWPEFPLNKGVSYVEWPPTK